MPCCFPIASLPRDYHPLKFNAGIFFYHPLLSSKRGSRIDGPHRLNLRRSGREKRRKKCLPLLHFFLVLLSFSLLNIYPEKYFLRNKGGTECLTNILFCSTSRIAFSFSICDPRFSVRGVSLLFFSHLLWKWYNFFYYYIMSGPDIAYKRDIQGVAEFVVKSFDEFK